MTTLNRINSNSVAVQTFLGAQEVSPGLEIHCSLEHGKSKTTIAGNEHHRVMEKQESNDKCKASVTSIEQSFPEVTDNFTLHNDAKVTSGYYLTKVFRKQVEDIHSRTTYPPSSFIPFSTLDEQDQKHLQELNMQLNEKKQKNERLAGWTSHNFSLQGTGFAQDDRVRVSTEGDRVWLVKGIKEDGRFKLIDESDKETIYVKKRYILEVGHNS